MSAEIVLLVPTCRKLEVHLDPLVALFDHFWPDHPELIVISDRGGFRYPNRYIGQQSEFAPLLFEALTVLEQERRLPEWCFLVLEDLAPLWMMDQARLHGIVATAQESELGKVNFFIREESHDDLREERVNGMPFRRVERRGRFVWPNPLQPALWRTPQLLEATRRALTGFRDPWSFEQLDLDFPAYAAAMPWPTVFHGLSHMDRINLKAVRAVEDPAVRAVRRHFLRQFVYREFRYHLGRSRKIPTKLRKLARRRRCELRS